MGRLQLCRLKNGSRHWLKKMTWTSSSLRCKSEPPPPTTGLNVCPFPRALPSSQTIKTALLPSATLVSSAALALKSRGPAPRRSQEVQDLSGTSALITDDDKGRAWSLEIQRALGAPELFVPVAVRQMVC